MSRKSHKPPRPFGVTLAIAASVLLYTVAPLMIVGQILLVEQHFQRMEPSIPQGDQPLEQIASGGDFRGGISDTQLFLQTALGFGFLAIAVFTWRGRPALMRHVFTSAVISITALTLILILFTDSNDAGISGGSLDRVFASFSVLQIGMYIMIPAYVVWYMNRAPARAFFRGTYDGDQLNQNRTES